MARNVGSSVSICAVLTLACTFGLTSPSAKAVPLSPGGSASLPGAADGIGGGTLVSEVMRDFQITGAGGSPLLFEGILHQRVVELDSTGTLSFEYRIIETVSGLNGIVDDLQVRSFTGFYTDVDYIDSASGAAFPVRAQRDPAGSIVRFDFTTDPVTSGAESKWSQVGTDALTYRNGGKTRVTLTTGQFVELDTLEPSEAFEEGCRTVDFEDRPLNTEYPVGSTFVSNGVPIRVREYYFNAGCVNVYTEGMAKIDNAGLACGSGQDLLAGNTNLEFDYGVQLNAWEVSFGDLGGSVNFSVNGQCFVVDDFADLPAVVGGVNVTVMGLGNNCGILRLDGPINQVIIGGQELWIDDVRCDVDVCLDDTTPPVAQIDQPMELSCVCHPVEIYGTATDANFAFYTLEQRRLGDPLFSTINSSSTPVLGGLLGIWNAAAALQGYHLIKLTAHDACNYSTTDEIVVWLGGIFDNLTVGSPGNGSILGQVICITGTAVDNGCFRRYAVDYRPVASANFMPVDPGTPFYTSSVINSTLATWNTVAQAVPDGDYVVRVRAEENCGDVVTETRTITVDNTAPLAEITQPMPCEVVDGMVEVFGTASDANLAGWILQYTGGGSPGWITIASGNSSVIGGLLGVWNTTNLEPCAYTLRLVVTDQAVLNCNGVIHHQAEYLVSVTVGEGVCGDCDGDGDVDLVDWNEIEGNFTGP